MDESSAPSIGHIESEFVDDLASNRFDQYLFVTYRVDEPYLEQFGPDDLVLIRGPGEVGDVVEEIDKKNVKWRLEDAHAKCYLMWNNETLKVWLGSFNLTETGLRTSIEWVVTHEAPFDAELALSDIRDGTCDPETVTSDVLFQQILDILIATIENEPPALSADIRSTPQSGAVTVLTNGALPGPSGFHEAVDQILNDARGEVELAYFTPYVTVSGVNALAETVPDRFADVDLDIDIRTCRIEEVDDPETYVEQEELEALDARYGSVELLARSSGSPGEKLKEGKLRSGMAHFKLLVISYQRADGTDCSEVLLTSANLSENAWSRPTDQLEFGLWVRDPALTQQLKTFFCDQLQDCYSEPNQLDFETISSLKQTDPLLRKRSLFDLISSRCSVKSSEVCLDWTDSDPSLEQVQATLILRDVTTGEPDKERIILSQTPESDAYRGSFDQSPFRPGAILRRVKLSVTTPVRPIEYELTAAGYEELVDPDSFEATIDKFVAFLEQRNINWDHLLVNDSLVIDGQGKPTSSVESIESIRVRRYFNGGPRDFPKNVTPKTQPHLGSSPFADVATAVEEINPFGGFGCIDVTATENVRLKHDMLTFVDDTGSLVDYLGYTEHDKGCSYVFDDAVAGSSLSVEVGKPYDSHFSDTRRRVTMPAEIPETHPRIRDLCEADTYQFTHRPIVTGSTEGNRADEYITSDKGVQIVPANEIVSSIDTKDRLAYEWRRRVGGYRAPTNSSLDQSIPPNPAHSHIEYRGLVKIGEKNSEISLRTPAKRFRVRQEVFATQTTPDSKVVQGRNLEDITPDDHVGWLVFTSDSLLKPSIRLGSDRSIDLAVTIGEEDYDCSQSYRVFAGGGEMFLIPIFGRQIEGTIRVMLHLRVAGGPSSFGTSELVKKLRHERTAEGIRRTVCDAAGNRQSQIEIPHDPNQRVPRLGMYQDRIHSNDLERYLDRSESFHVCERTPSELIIEARDATVLCLGPFSPE